MLLADCANTFREALRRLARLNKTTAEELYVKWQAYAKTCQDYDQSAVLFEFCQWNNLIRECHCLGLEPLCEDCAGTGDALDVY